MSVFSTGLLQIRTGAQALNLQPPTYAEPIKSRHCMYLRPGYAGDHGLPGKD
jgi:hypothetical protein